MSTLRLRSLQTADETPFAAAHAAMAAESFSFGLGYHAGLEWTEYLSELEAARVGDELPNGLVPATFLVADIDGEIVGRTSVRHRLNEFLAREGGHIGYAVLPEFRCRGFATAILQQSLVIARSKGIARVLITCDDHNIASATVIERCGGVFESLVEGSESGIPKRRYWIE